MATPASQARLRITPGDAAFVDAVLSDLGRIARTSCGRALFRRVRDAARIVTIDKPPPLDSPNAWTKAADRRAATLRDRPTGETDAQGAPVLGTGTGSDCTVSLNPVDWPNPAQPGSPTSDVVLFDQLCQAVSLAKGLGEYAGGEDGARSSEISQALAQYLHERQALEAVA